MQALPRLCSGNKKAERSAWSGEKPGVRSQALYPLSLNFFIALLFRHSNEK
jgi:hypothetical protein